MKTTFLKSFICALALCLGASASTRADVKIRTRSTSEGHTSESTVYIKGARERTERGAGTADILQCDRKQSVEVDDNKKTYTITPLAAPSATTTTTTANRNAQTPSPNSAGVGRRGGVITVSVTTTDLNETKKFPQFGNLIARHYKRVMVMEATPDACSPVNMRVETDGWYADVQADISCNVGLSQMAAAQMARRGCQDRHEYKTVGPTVRGYPLLETTTTTINMNMQGQTFNRTSTSTQEVVELSNAPLSLSLFEVPAGYREVKAEVFNMSGDEDADTDNDDNGASENATRNNARAGVGSGTSAPSVNQPLPATTGNATPMATPALGPKKAGVIRVGIVAPNVTAASGLTPATLAAAVQGSLVTTLKGPALEVAPLEARLPAQIEAEAREKECDYILYTNVAHKKGGGGGGLGGFLRKAAPVVDVLPMGSGTSAVVADVATQTAIYTTAEIASSVKAKDEVTIDYRLMSTANNTTPVAAKTLKGKAKSDGEDVFTPLVQQEASAVLTEATKK